MDASICADGPREKCDLLEEVETSLVMASYKTQVEPAKKHPQRVVKSRAIWSMPEFIVNSFVRLFLT